MDSPSEIVDVVIWVDTHTATDSAGRSIRPRQDSNLLRDPSPKSSYYGIFIHETGSLETRRSRLTSQEPGPSG